MQLISSFTVEQCTRPLSKKYLYLSDVLDFYELGNTLKAHKKEQANRPPRGAAGVAYGNPVHCGNCGNLCGN